MSEVERELVADAAHQQRTLAELSTELPESVEGWRGVRRLDHCMGDDLNEASDTLWFTLLFKREELWDGDRL